MPTYRLRHRIVGRGEDLTITDERRRRIYHIDGNVAHRTHTIILTDRRGDEVLTLFPPVRVSSWTLNMQWQGEQRAVVEKSHRDVTHLHFSVFHPHGDPYRADVEVCGRGYMVMAGTRCCAMVTQRLLTNRQTYTVEVVDPVETLVMLGTAIAIDELLRRNDPYWCYS